MLLTAIGIAPAHAVHTERYQVPYFGILGEFMGTDSARDSGNGEGFQIQFGVPLQSGHSAVELRYFDLAIKDRPIDKDDNFQTGLFVDYVRDFGPLGEGAGRFSGVKPFATLGVGFIEEDEFRDKHIHLGLDGGAGLLIPVGYGGWAARLEGRIQGQSNNETCDEEAVAAGRCSRAASFLVDYQIGLGIQIPMTLFFDRPVSLAPAEDCPVAVVDPETGRRDCAIDSDRDGVSDNADECPGTPAGTAVNENGCSDSRAVNDHDGDGVLNDDDRCPDTHAGFKVNGEGCLVAQKTALAGVTFQPNSTRLTPQGRQTLDGVVGTLKAQEDLRIEIAGHTDSVGSEAYNTLLSQQRAEAVRTYLIERGLDASRVTAVGYGELEPVDTNETEEGRRANRRVEFRISSG